MRKHWFCPDCIRSAQAGGAYAADLLHAGDNLHVEVKRRKKIAATHFMEQAERDKREEDIPVVVMREDGYPTWLVVLRIEDTQKFLDVICKNKESNNGTDDAIQGVDNIDSDR